MGAVASTGPPPATQARRASHRLLARPQALPVAIQWPVVRAVTSARLTGPGDLLVPRGHYRDSKMFVSVGHSDTGVCAVFFFVGFNFWV